MTTEFPIFLTEAELKELINTPHSHEIWHKVNNALSILQRGESCCPDMEEHNDDD